LPQGSDLASDMSSSAYQSLLEIYRRMVVYLEWTTEEIEKIISAYGQTIAILPPQEVAAMIEAVKI
jgi:tRNA (cmo5U34)-methyltransferase